MLNRCEPPRILYTRKTYVVISRKDKTAAKNNINVAGYEQLHSVLAKSKSLDRHQFLIILANIEYQRSELLDQIETLSRNSAAEHKDIAAWRHRLSELDTSMRALDKFNVWGKLITKEHHFLEFNSPRLFLVLPKDLKQWSDQDPTTHQFRLYFLCEFDYWLDFPVADFAHTLRAAPAHIHISDHPGYDLERPSEFFQRYGQVAMAILELVQFGYLSEHLFVPSLKSPRILYCCEGVKARHSLNKANIKSLVNKSIASLSLQKFVPPGKRLFQTSISVLDTWHIRSFLRSSRPDNGLGSLVRTTVREKSLWLCRGHSFHPWTDQQLCYLISTFSTRFHMQLGALDIRLRSTQECLLLCAVLNDIPHLYELSIHIVWEATLDALRLCLTEICTSGVKVLHIHEINKVRDEKRKPARELFFTSVDQGDMKFIIVDNYRAPSTKSVFLGKIHFMQCLLLFRQKPKKSCANTLSAPYKPIRPDIDWMDLIDAVRTFITELHYMKAGAKPPTEISTLLNDLSVRLTEHRALGLAEIQIFDAESSEWQGTFAVKDGVVQGLVKSRVLTILPLDSLTHGALRELDVPSIFPDYLPGVQYILYHSPQLQSITLPAKVNSTLAHISFLSQQCRIPSLGLIGTIQHWASDKWRAVAQVRLKSHDPSKVGAIRFVASKAHLIMNADGAVTGVEFLYWKHDHVSDPLVDSIAGLLDAATASFPSVMKSFHMDLSSLTQRGLTHIKNMLRRSALEQLHVRCVFLNPSLERSVADVLRAISWTSIKSLVLSGDKIDFWVQLWAYHGNLLSTGDGLHAFSSGPQLLRLVIYGARDTEQALSHAGSLVIHHVVYSSPILELRLENIRFQEEQDWLLVIGAVDLPLMECYHGMWSYIQHIKVLVPEQLISTTAEDDLMILASIEVQKNRINRSRQIGE